MATPPTFVTKDEVASWATTTSPRNLPSFSPAAGDLLLGFLTDETSDGQTNDISISGGPTWANVQDKPGTANADCCTRVMSATAAGGSITPSISNTITQITPSEFGATVLEFASHGGIGASTGSTNGVTGTHPQLSITTTGDNSAIAVIFADFNAGAVPTSYDTVNGLSANVQTAVQTATHYTVSVVFWADAGAAGSKTVGATYPATADAQIIAVEILGTSAGAIRPHVGGKTWRRRRRHRQRFLPAVPAITGDVTVTPAVISAVTTFPQLAVSVEATPAVASIVTTAPQAGVGVGAAPAEILVPVTFPVTTAITGTRLYFTATTTPAVSPAFDGGWASTGEAVRRKLLPTKAAATETLSGSFGNTAGDNDLIVQAISNPLSGAQTIGGAGTSWSGMGDGRELLDEDNINQKIRTIKVISNDGSTVRGTLVSFAAAGNTTEMTTSLSGQLFASGGGLTSVSALDGDRILVEFGFGSSAGGVTPNWEMLIGGSGTDHKPANLDTIGTVPWVEFSQDLVFGVDATIVTPAVISVVTTFPQLAVSVGAAPAFIPVPVTFPQAGVNVAAAPAVLNAVVSMTKANVSVGVVPGFIPVVVTLPQALAAETSIVTPAAIAVVVTAPQASVAVGVTPAVLPAVLVFPTATPTVIVGQLYFTPPHRGHFVPYSDEHYRETLTEPLLSLRPHNPRGVNLFLHEDGLLHEEQPKIVTVNTKMFFGGAIYGPLSQEDIDLLIASGYGAYLHSSPTPPEP